jgi:hypothetical protein
MIIYKLGGFVNDLSATLVEVTPKRAVIRTGARGLLPFWGKSDDRRPVRLDIEFGDEPVGSSSHNAASHRVEVTVRMRPLGWVRNRDVFEARAKRVLKALRSYFVAD